MQIRSVVLEE